MRKIIGTLFVLGMLFSAGTVFSQEGGDSEKVEICVASICMPSPFQEGGDSE